MAANPLRLAFMGTPDFSVPILSALMGAGHTVVAVYSQPPRAAGRGQKTHPSAVQAFAEQQGIEVRTPKSLKDPETQAAFANLNLDVAVVAAYGLILPKAVLEAPRLGCINVHASLLPRWRGAAPIQRAILAGDKETGVTIMQMDAGLDTGAMLLTEAVEITDATTAQSLHDAVSDCGARLVTEALKGLDEGRLDATPQPVEGVTVAPKIDRAEGRIDWTRPAVELERAVRALTPWPGVWFEHDGERIKVLAAEVIGSTGAPGAILDDLLLVACGQNALRLTRVQRSGKGPMDSGDFLRGYPLTKGMGLA